MILIAFKSTDGSLARTQDATKPSAPASLLWIVGFFGIIVESVREESTDLDNAMHNGNNLAAAVLAIAEEKMLFMALGVRCGVVG